jgi:hypothetical protein
MGFYEKFKLVFSDTFTFFLPLVITFLKNNGPIILEIALKIIPLIAVSLAAGTNDDKHSRAFALIKAEAKEKGLDPSDAMINAAIEIAVADLKEKQKK